MARVNPYKIGLEKNAAKYTPLTPLSLLARTAYTYPRRPWRSSRAWKKWGSTLPTSTG